MYNTAHTAAAIVLTTIFSLILLAGSTSAKDSGCPDHAYKVLLFSQDPLVIYIPNFLTAEEADYLERTTKSKFTKSEVADSHGHQLNASTRTSRSTSLASDPIIRCIESRALSFQGFDTPRSHLEPLQLVTYGLGEEYHAHTDWFEAASQTSDAYGGNRQSSFFVYVAASSDITGGGTNFPLLDAPVDERWCKFVNCDEPWEAGVTFRPVPRNAVFWVNLLKDGRGDKRVVHAGLPVTSGTKLGMNIWTRERALHQTFRSDGADDEAFSEL
ncbi:uncharacterized protein BDZ99DRAFT_444194 [Mytilinidion resinicola]|uniref:Fe2OG dioxygenase domain-containing protein n=1 Tax=Mytilinidion resinicola TaxID=574789 RepID=A0A6A6YLG4_9PEZI|nr:uncharacterized protein BDZ99DRAFT_444194 [Mytilinidion resinicola]KAF2809716.1 hypothetical protein BDZ99DRAFT_444194 [Mytilinidion resinicola]